MMNKLLALILSLSLVFIGSAVRVDAVEESVNEICGKCGNGFITYYCAGDAYVWDTSTHTKNGVTCTIKGYKCQTRSRCDYCNRDLYEGTHFCYEIHSGCGLGVWNYCTLQTSVPTPDGRIMCCEHEHGFNE